MNSDRAPSPDGFAMAFFHVLLGCAQGRHMGVFHDIWGLWVVFPLLFGFAL
jgi:hypothetical protein